ncbi:MAG: glycerophosphodiester phosphodiesterase [Acidimicrobiales bacterium]
MPTRLPARRLPPIGFAHRGARAHARENTLESFLLARRLGATGLESDAWLTRDGHVVLDHDGVVGRMRKRPLFHFERAGVPGHIPTLEDLYLACGTDYELALDIKNPAAIEPVVAIAQRYRATDRLWVCHHDWRLVATWRELDPDIKLVDSTRLRQMKDGAERRAAQLAEAGIDAVNMHVSDWNGGLTTLFHRFDRYTLAWDAQFERQLDEVVDMGIDGVFSDHTDRMVGVIAKYFPEE